MQLNDLIALLMQIPVTLAAGWAVWFAVGLGLSIWGRREKLYVPAAYEAPARPKSGVRSARPAKVVPSTVDAFGELEALLEPQEGTHRTPGEAPAASPVLTEAPRLAAPQSLP
jgi:hypothetical protein